MKMRRLLTAFMALITATCSWAVNAYPMPVEVRQCDGTLLTVVLHGDEHFHYYTTLDGVLLVQHEGNYYVAATRADGELAVTKQLAHNEDQRSADEKKLAARQERQKFIDAGVRLAEMQRIKREPIITSGTLFPHIGKPKVVVIMAEFPDKKFSIENPKRSFEEYFNSSKRLNDYGFGETSNITSVAQYFSNVSFGQYRPQFDIYGPVMMPDSLKVYGGTNSTGDDESMSKLFKDACNLLDSEIDFSQYDENADGNVDLVLILFAGYSQSMSGNDNSCIWPKSGTVNVDPTFDKKNIKRYAVSAELNGFPGCWTQPPYVRINGIGTLAHEFCHTLGLPDFYPTKNNLKENNQGMEYWSLMDLGNYLHNGYYPTALNAWEREAFGWMEIPTLVGDTVIDLRSIDDGGRAYRILNDNNESGEEYYIIENIQNIQHNYGQRGHGMVVYHVDYNASLFSLASNKVNNTPGHPRMTVVPADGLLMCSKYIGNKYNGETITNAIYHAQIAGDPFPGTAKTTCLNDTMQLPNFQVYKGLKVNKAFTDIKEEDGVVSFRFIQDFQAYTDGMEPVLNNTDRKSDDAFYSLDGRKAGNDLTRLPKGIYIRDGKKFVRN